MNRLQEKRPTSASMTLLLAVAPPAQSKLRKLYDDTFEFHALRLNDNVPTVPHRLNAFYSGKKGRTNPSIPCQK